MLKRIRKVKWENIITIAMSIIAIQRLLLIINSNGVYTLAIIGARYLIKDLRINPTNWLIEK